MYNALHILLGLNLSKWIYWTFLIHFWVQQPSCCAFQSHQVAKWNIVILHPAAKAIEKYPTNLIVLKSDKLQTKIKHCILWAHMSRFITFILLYQHSVFSFTFISIWWELTRWTKQTNRLFSLHWLDKVLPWFFSIQAYIFVCGCVVMVRCGLLTNNATILYFSILVFYWSGVRFIHSFIHT